MGIGFRKLAAAGVVAALALTGCAQDPNVAARVGEITITDSEVQQATAAMSEAFDVTAGQARPVAFASLMRGAFAENLAAKHGYTVTPQERADAFAANPDLAMLELNESTRPLANGVADSIVLAQRLGPEELAAEVAGLDVTMNPRFGVWNGETGEFGGSGSLSQPTAPTGP